MTTAFEIRPVRSSEADHLLNLLDAYMDSLYPAKSNHLVSPDNSSGRRWFFWAAFAVQTVWLVWP